MTCDEFQVILGRPGKSNAEWFALVGHANGCDGCFRWLSDHPAMRGPLSEQAEARADRLLAAARDDEELSCYLPAARKTH